MFRDICLIVAVYLSTSAAFRLSPTQQHTFNTQPLFRSQTKLQMYEDEGRPALSFKAVGIFVVGIVGVFGVSFMSTSSSLFKDIAIEKSGGSKLKASSEEGNRGSKTKLTRREVNAKLSQLPIFYVSNDSGGVFTSDSTGKIFENKEDAEKYLKQMSGRGASGLKVKSASFDEVYYPLIAKTAKPSVYEGPARTSDPTANYQLVGNEKEVQNTNIEWRTSHNADFPLYRVPKVAFQKEDGLELPLFERKDDALLAYKRLQESKGESDTVPAEIQTTSVLDIIQKIWGSGGSESRALEIYPSVQNLEDFKSLALDEIDEL
jgi:hypothetical protein